MSKKKSWCVRQGDVLLTRIERKPAGDWRPLEAKGGKVILAYGEVTGHHHRFESAGVCELRAEGVFERILHVSADGAVPLVHEEHGAIPVPPGLYRIEIQREYHPEDLRNVAD